MLKWKEEYSEPTTKELEYYFHQFFWDEIITAVKDPYFLLNANNALVSAIRKGVVRYTDGKFVGDFSMQVSTELEKFAKFDARTKTWKGIPPASISATAAIANNKAKSLNEKISSLIDDIPDRVTAAVDSLKYSIEKPLEAMNAQATEDLKSTGIVIDVTPEISKTISENYTNNLNISIKNWVPNQTERLRNMVEKNILSGYNRLELIDMISAEYGTSMAKAKFLARQETTLLTSTVRDERYQGAGIRKYRWSASGGKAGDGRTRDLHRKLHGNEFSYASPPIIDERSGERGTPGKAFGCRCAAIPIV